MPRGIPNNKPPLSSCHVEKRSIACIHSINEAVICVTRGNEMADLYRKIKYKPIREHGSTRKIRNLTD